MIHSYEIPLSVQASELFSELYFGPDPIFNVLAICHSPQKIETVSSPFNISCSRLILANIVQGLCPPSRRLHNSTLGPTFAAVNTARTLVVPRTARRGHPRL
jgi:hypothetical protein